MKLYLDSNIFIYTVEKSNICKESLNKLSVFIADNSAKIMTSEITIAECLNLPTRNKDLELISIYSEMLERGDDIEKIPLTYDVIKSAIDIIGAHNLKLIDALHMACALKSECAYFVTADKRIKSIAGVEVMRFDVNFEIDIIPNLV